MRLFRHSKYKNNISQSPFSLAEMTEEEEEEEATSIINYLILAGGYGTRLHRDLVNASSSLTEQDNSHYNKQNQLYTKYIGLPKALMPLGSKPLLSRWLDILAEAKVNSDLVYMITNSTFYKAFCTWAASSSSSSPPPTDAKNEDIYRVQLQQLSMNVKNICDNGRQSVDDRLGAIGDLNEAISRFNLLASSSSSHSHLCVIGSDTIFYRDFKLSAVVEYFRDVNRLFGPSNVVLYYECSDLECLKTGILGTKLISRSNNGDSGGSQKQEEVYYEQVMAFVEKPKPYETSDRRACPCFYLFHADCLPLVKTYLLDGWDKDAAGKFIQYCLHKQFQTFAMKIEGRLEVGDLKSYHEADDYFTSF